MAYWSALLGHPTDLQHLIPDTEVTFFSPKPIPFLSWRSSFGRSEWEEKPVVLVLEEGTIWSEVRVKSHKIGKSGPSMKIFKLPKPRLSLMDFSGQPLLFYQKWEDWQWGIGADRNRASLASEYLSSKISFIEQFVELTMYFLIEQCNRRWL